MSVAGGDPETLPVTPRKTKTEVSKNLNNQVYCLKPQKKLARSLNVRSFGQRQLKQCK
jgi:hypothetical protein